MNTNKRHYVSMTIFPVGVQPLRCDLMAASLTTVPITVGSVTVEEFKAGFHDEYGNDFKELDFD